MTTHVECQPPHYFTPGEPGKIAVTVKVPEVFGDPRYSFRMLVKQFTDCVSERGCPDFNYKCRYRGEELIPGEEVVVPAGSLIMGFDRQGNDNLWRPVVTVWCTSSISLGQLHEKGFWCGEFCDTNWFSAVGGLILRLIKEHAHFSPSVGMFLEGASDEIPYDLTGEEVDIAERIYRRLWDRRGVHFLISNDLSDDEISLIKDIFELKENGDDEKLESLLDLALFKGTTK